VYFTLFTAALTIQLAYWIVLGIGFSRVRKNQPQETGGSPEDLPISVIVAARNEEQRLPKLLDKLELQTYGSFEVVIADDGSTDGTAELIEARAALWEERGGIRLRCIRVEEGEAESQGLPRKKHALTRAIAGAAHDRLVFTDADCEPPPNWLAILARHAAPNGVDDGAVLIGYGPLRKQPGLLNAFVRYETLLSAFMATSAVGWKQPFMAVGRNFSYTKSVFEHLGGFEHSAASLSGDDDLLVQKVARTNAAPVRYVLDSGSFVSSDAPATCGGWLRQKLRHTSAGRYYSRATKTHLLVFHASNLLLWLGVPVLRIASGTWLGVGLLAVRFLVQRAALRPAERAFGVGDLSLSQPFLDGLYLLYNTLIAPVGVLLKPKRW
jgi:cellulose synthase/poly-beta-1,6-N-acetylglucosamine synthase-like glycosyltransferase